MKRRAACTAPTRYRLDRDQPAALFFRPGDLAIDRPMDRRRRIRPERRTRIVRELGRPHARGQCAGARIAEDQGLGQGWTAANGSPFAGARLLSARPVPHSLTGAGGRWPSHYRLDHGPRRPRSAVRGRWSHLPSAGLAPVAASRSEASEAAVRSPADVVRTDRSTGRSIRLVALPNKKGPAQQGLDWLLSKWRHDQTWQRAPR